MKGIAVSPGIAIGEALVIDSVGFVIPRQTIARDELDAALLQLDDAIESVWTEIEQDRQSIAARLGEQYGAIFSAHQQMLRDPQLRRELEACVRQERCSAPLAVSKVLGRYAQLFREMENVHLAERSHDVLDLEQRLLAHLLGQQRISLRDLETPCIVLAHDLTPGQTAQLDRDHVLGFVTEAGGEGGHTAILARGLEIPAAVGAGPVLDKAQYGDLVIVDGDTGTVILRPDQETLQQYRAEVHRRQARATRLLQMRSLPAQTRDGTAVELLANIEFPDEVGTCLERGAAGIGLYRTEFLYLGSDTEPTEQGHYRAYRAVLEAVGNRPVVIRTLDLGADKMGHLPRGEDEHNPCLGLRSVRLSLRNPGLFRKQLRAILRASVLGQARVMFPLVTTLRELRQAKLLLRETMEDLREQGLPFDPDIPVGMMVEVPAAVVMIDQFLKEVDFISIGTNDLIQYALAVDRGNKEVSDLYQACDPAVLRLIDMTLRAARTAGVPVTLCGQMSGTPHQALCLLGLGLRGFSVAPSDVPEIKELCRSVSIAQCEAIAGYVMQMENAQEIDVYLKEELKKLVPQLVA